MLRVLIAKGPHGLRTYRGRTGGLMGQASRYTRTMQEGDGLNPFKGIGFCRQEGLELVAWEEK